MSKNTKTLAIGVALGGAIIFANMLGLLAPFKVRASEVASV